jgi:hypothetical protein
MQYLMASHQRERTPPRIGNQLPAKPVEGKRRVRPKRFVAPQRMLSGEDWNESSRGMAVASSARQKLLRKRTESPHRSERGKSAKNGPERLQQGPSTEWLYSTTSSARASRHVSIGAHLACPALLQQRVELSAQGVTMYRGERNPTIPKALHVLWPGASGGRLLHPGEDIAHNRVTLCRRRGRPVQYRQ